MTVNSFLTSPISTTYANTALSLLDEFFGSQRNVNEAEYSPDNLLTDFSTETRTVFVLVTFANLGPFAGKLKDEFILFSTKAFAYSMAVPVGPALTAVALIFLVIEIVLLSFSL